MIKTSEVFGLSNTILPASYVDRGGLDEEIQKHLARKNHLALCGESKCGKSWLRQKNIPNAVTVQCRLKQKVTDIYVNALSQLGVKLTIKEISGTSFKGTIEAAGEAGIKLLAKLEGTLGAEFEKTKETEKQIVGRDINDLKHIADIIIASGKRLVIEDFHYLSIPERKHLSYELKTLWDYGCFVVIIGVWTQSNMLIYLNPDLSGRIVEIPISWNEADLHQVIQNGCHELKVTFSDGIAKELVKNSFGNVGIIQQLALLTLDEGNILEAQSILKPITDINLFLHAAMKYAEQLNSLYLQFAERVSKGIRNRKDSTGIYAHAMKVIMEAPDKDLLGGLSADRIFEVAHSRQNRIQKSNLKSILEKFDELQIDEDGRGLTISYNQANEKVSIVDRQLLFYRAYQTVKWPWEDLIAEAESGTGIA